jgi:hypothetical protein
LIQLDHYISLTSPKHVNRLHLRGCDQSSLNFSKRRTAEVIWPPPVQIRTRGFAPPEGRPARTPPPTFLFLPDSQLQTAGLAPRPSGNRTVVEPPRFRLSPETSDQWSLEELNRRANPPRRRRAEGAIYVPSDFIVNRRQINRPGLWPAGYLVMIPPF